MAYTQQVIIRKAKSLEFLTSRIGTDDMEFTDDPQQARDIEMNLNDLESFRDLANECNKHDLIVIAVTRPIVLGCIMYRGGMDLVEEN